PSPALPLPSAKGGGFSFVRVQGEIHSPLVFAALRCCIRSGRNAERARLNTLLPPLGASPGEGWGGVLLALRERHPSPALPLPLAKGGGFPSFVFKEEVVLRSCLWRSAAACAVEGTLGEGDCTPCSSLGRNPG